MLSKRHGRSFLWVAAACFLSATAPAKADVLVERDGTIFGKITQITDNNVLVAKGCNNSDIKTIPKQRVKYYQFDTSCTPHKFVLPTSPLQLCDQPKQQIQKVYFHGQDREIYAIEVVLSDDKIIRLKLPNNAGSLQGPLNKIKSIVPASVCPKSIPDKFTWPKEYCHEPFQVAVNFSLKPVYNNKVFTRAFSFYLDVVGDSGDSLSAAEFSRAFGAALTLWTSKLLALRTKLGPELAVYVDSILARSTHYALLTPPQVVQVDCPENAVMIVKLYTARQQNLFPAKSGYIAKAQLEGRTILLNGADFQFRSDLDTRMFLKNNQVNLTTVFAHELGHCFGLPDVGSDSQAISIMNADNIANDQAGSPTDSDGIEFVKILQQMVTGARPGEFKAEECAGLRLHKRNVK
jgi:hypothetical protein